MISGQYVNYMLSGKSFSLSKQVCYMTKNQYLNTLEYYMRELVIFLNDDSSLVMGPHMVVIRELFLVLHSGTNPGSTQGTRWDARD